jgi:hypothetical protein
VWREDACLANPYITIDKQVYMLSADGRLMPPQEEPVAAGSKLFQINGKNALIDTAARSPGSTAYQRHRAASTNRTCLAIGREEHARHPVLSTFAENTGQRQCLRVPTMAPDGPAFDITRK